MPPVRPTASIQLMRGEVVHGATNACDTLGGNRSMVAV